MNDDVYDKELKCIKIVSKILVENERAYIKPLKAKIKEYFSTSFGFSLSGASIASVIIYFLVLPFIIFFIPIGIFFVLLLHAEEINSLRKIKKQHLNNSYTDIKHISHLWNRFGLKNWRNDNEVIDAINDWIGILYGKQYCFPQEDIKELFELEQQRQAKAYNECYAKNGIRLNLIDWRDIVIDNILSKFPNYDK